MPATIPTFDLYAELGVDPNASSEAIGAAYRALIRRHHPDLAGDAGVERSKRLNVAYAWLRDPAMRDAYDTARAVPVMADEPPMPTSRATDWSSEGRWPHDPEAHEQANRATGTGSRRQPGHAQAERPRRHAPRPPRGRTASGRAYPTAETHQPARGETAQESRVLVARLIKLAAAAVAIAVLVSAVQNGGTIIGGRKPHEPPIAALASEDAVSTGNAATLTPSDAAAQTPAATLKPDVMLQGRHPYWTSTGIRVTAGERLLITASGQILWDPGVREPTVGPGGASWTPDNVASPDEFLFQQSPIASLIGEIAGTMFWIGASQEITAPASGELKLAMNERWVDGAWDDNQGSWAVVVEREHTKAS